jgi:hypothetical protein
VRSRREWCDLRCTEKPGGDSWSPRRSLSSGRHPRGDGAASVPRRSRRARVKHGGWVNRRVHAESQSSRRGTATGVYHGGGWGRNDVRKIPSVESAGVASGGAGQCGPGRHAWPGRGKHPGRRQA